MFDYRIRFSKTGRAIYISHLDLMHTFQRAFSRAGYRLDYSEGFNPHPEISIALPLGVGCSSVCEILDFNGEKPDADILNSTLPEGIRVDEVYIPERKASEIRFLKVCGEFCYDNRPVPDLNAMFSKESITVLKKTKRGVGEADIKPMIKSIVFSGTSMEAVICAQNPTLNPEYLARALGDDAPDFAKFERKEIYDEDMNIFR